MRAVYSAVFLIVAAALLVCAVIAYRTKRTASRSVTLLLLALIPPVIGNMIIVYTGNKLLSTAGCYIYFCGMDLVMMALVGFAIGYCQVNIKNDRLQLLFYIPFAIDIFQFVLNPFFGNAFRVAPSIVDGYAYYKLVPFAGQMYHRILDYAVFFGVIILFIVKTKKTPRIYAERYSLILISMIVVGLIQTYYIFSRSPIDRSMVGYGLFGFLVFYFAIFYKPVRLLDRMLALVSEEMPDAIFLFDASHSCIWANRLGISLAGLSENNFRSAGDTLRRKFGALEKDGNWVTERTIGAGDEARHYVLDRHVVPKAGSFLIVHDATEDRREMQKKVYEATHDDLTGLHVREHMYKRIRKEIDSHPDTVYDIIYIDVDDFKLANDVFGTEFGDHVLCSIADWIRREFHGPGIYGRLFGDKFGVCLPKDSVDKDRVEAELSHFIVRRGSIKYALSIHMGVYTISEPQLDVSVMFDRAYMALDTIKENVKVHIAYYDEEMRRRALWARDVSSEIQKAIEAGEVQPYLQAQMDRNGRIVGAEALVRWIHPERGFLPPASFLPAIEKNGLISEVDRFMWRSACRILSRWKDNDLFISVNISPKDFYYMDVAAELKGLVREYGVAPERLRLEITETVMMSDVENRIRILDDLRASGFIIEMDDFGSGYSSLNMLKDMPVDVLKIDMAFLRESRQKARTSVIMRSIIRMSDELGMESLTEGVETENQFRELSEMGCKMFQGYYFAKPVPVEEFEKRWVA